MAPTVTRELSVPHRSVTPGEHDGAVHIAAVALTLLLTVLLVGSGIAKLARVSAVVASVTGVGWPGERLWVLAAIEFLGAAGLLIGLVVPGIGIAAAVGAVLYFLGAVLSHLRLRQSPAQAGVPLLVSVATLVVLVLA